jgi:sodium-coupled neutral amino acid transporter 7/8
MSDEDYEDDLLLHNPVTDGHKMRAASGEPLIMRGEHTPKALRQEREGTGTIMSSIFSLGSSAIGAGVLAFPYAFEQAGLVSALIATCLMTMVMLFCHHAITHTAIKVRERDPTVRSYQELVANVIGQGASKTFEVVVIVYQFGVCAGFMIIFGDMAPPVVKLAVGATGGEWYCDRTFLIPLATALVLFPLCLLRTLYSLRHASLVSLAAVLYTVAMVVSKEQSQTTAAPVVDFEANTGIFTSLPLMCFGLQNHIPAPLVFFELPRAKQTQSNMNFICAAAYALCLLLYLGCGATGYLTFGDATVADILKNYAADDSLATVARGAIAIVALCGYAINHVPSRSALHAVYMRRKHANENLDDTPKTRRSSSGSMTGQFVLQEATIWIALTLVLAVFCEDLGVVFDLSGATCGTLVIFFVPGAFWWKQGPSSSCKRVGPCAVVWTLGGVIMVMGTAITIINQINGTA